MHQIAIKVDPARLTNPDTDLRHALPGVIAERSNGVVMDDGFDYGPEADSLVVFLTTARLELALPCILEVIGKVRVLNNDLRTAAVVALKRNNQYEVVYPQGYKEKFLV